MTELPVNQIFFGYQFEGGNMGIHSLWLRLQGCAAECADCQTPWACEDGSEEVTVDNMLAKERLEASSFAVLTVAQLVEVLRDIQPPPYHLVICGGDPAHYELLELTQHLSDIGYELVVQTKGTLPMQIDQRTYLSVRPTSFRVAPGVLVDADEVILQISEAAQLKELDLLLEYVDDAITEVFLQPSPEAPEAIDLCMQLCPERGYRLSYRPDSFCAD